MALKRMFSKQITDSDAFLDMPIDSQLLYFHLGMNADDEGFIGNPKRIMRVLGLTEKAWQPLVSKRFVIVFPSGIAVIKHWLIHNTIRMDRFNPTGYQNEKNLLFIKENRAYTDVATKGKPLGNQLVTQVKLSKVKLSKKEEVDKSTLPLLAKKKKTMRYYDEETGDYGDKEEMLAKRPKKPKNKDAEKLRSIWLDKCEEYLKFRPIVGYKEYKRLEEVLKIFKPKDLMELFKEEIITKGNDSLMKALSNHNLTEFKRSREL